MRVESDHARVLPHQGPVQLGRVQQPSTLSVAPPPTGTPAPLPPPPASPPSPTDSPDPAAPVSPDAAPADAGTRARGLLDRLESGHFQGVASVRLSINFFDELQARAATRTAAAVQQNSGPLTDAADAAVEGFIDSLSLGEDAAATLRDLGSDFRETLGTILAGDGSADSASLEDRIGAAFEEFVGSLRGALAPPPPPPPTSSPTPAPAPEPGPAPAPTDGPLPAPPADPLVAAVQVPTVASPTPTTDPADPIVVAPPSPTDPAPAPSLDEAIASLGEAFAGALSTFLSAVRDAGSLPEPTAPRGHGGAYQKFLAIYNSLRQPATTAVDEAA